MSSTRCQYLATFYVDLLGLNYGLAAGWTSAAIPLLQSSETPLSASISNEDASLIGSVLPIGAIAGSLMFGYASSKFGRKRSSFLLAFPQIIGWLLMYFAENAMLLIAFRFLAGISAGGIFTVVPVYISEISEDRVRGLLGSTLILFFSLGLLLTYVFGAFLPYFLVPWMSIPFSILFLLGFYFMPETPAFLAQRGRLEEAESSLKYYRGALKIKNSDNLCLKIELEAIISSMETNQSSISCSDFKGSRARKALTYGIFLVALNQICGCFAMLNFTGMIFKESGSTLSPNISSIIVGVIQIVGGIICTFSVEKAGRKSLLAISLFGITIGLAVFSCFTFARSRGVNLTSFTWIPLLSLSFVTFISNLGIQSLPFLYISEIVPTNIKSFTMTLCLSIHYLCSSLVLQYLLASIEQFGIHGTMLLFAINSLIGALVVVLFFPETKGKSYDEISKLLK